MCPVMMVACGHHKVPAGSFGLVLRDASTPYVNRVLLAFSSEMGDGAYLNTKFLPVECLKETSLSKEDWLKKVSVRRFSR
jgi:hypothetical protein